MKPNKIVIEAGNDSIFSMRDILQYKTLLQNLAKRDFSVRYKQAFAGIAWALVKPLINILVFGYLSSKIRGDANSVDNFLDVAIAMTLWQLFSNVYSDVSNSIVGNSNLFSKVFFPKIIIPLSTILVSMVDFIISLTILVVLFVISGHSLHWQVVLAPVFIFLTLLNGFGIGLYFATINVKFRDVKFIVPLILQIAMYASPVIFPSSYILERLPSYLHWAYHCNPMVAAIEGFRWSLTGGDFSNQLPFLAVSLIVSFLFLFIGVKYFYKFERSFVDYI